MTQERREADAVGRTSGGRHGSDERRGREQKKYLKVEGNGGEEGSAGGRGLRLVEE